MVRDRGCAHGTAAHPGGRKRRRAKGRGKEPEARRGDTHPATPWSRCRSAAGLSRGLALLEGAGSRWLGPAGPPYLPWF